MLLCAFGTSKPVLISVRLQYHLFYIIYAKMLYISSKTTRMCWVSIGNVFCFWLDVLCRCYIIITSERSKPLWTNPLDKTTGQNHWTKPLDKTTYDFSIIFATMFYMSSNPTRMCWVYIRDVVCFFGLMVFCRCYYRIL